MFFYLVFQELEVERDLNIDSQSDGFDVKNKLEKSNTN